MRSWTYSRTTVAVAATLLACLVTAGGGVVPTSVAWAEPSGLAPPGPVVELGDVQPRPDEVQLDPSLTNPEEPTPYLEEAWALADALRRLHPDQFGGLWREPDRLVIGVVDDRDVIEASVALLFPDPAFVTYRSVDWSEDALEHARSRFEARQQELFDEQEVHALGIDVRRNRVYLETSQHPSTVKWDRYVSGVPASMVLVEQQQPPQLVDGSGVPANSPSSSTAGMYVRLLAAVLLVALVFTQRKRLLTRSA